MNWKLIFSLSLIGIAMAVLSLYGLTGKFEPLFWLVIFVFYAWYIARHAPGKYFLHGFLVSLLNGIWIAVIHTAFFSMYLQHNPEMQANLRNFPAGFDPRVMMLIVGPIIGAITGIIAGLLAWIAAKLQHRT